MHSPAGKVSVDGLRLAQSFEATDLFQARKYSNSYEAYSAIMQQMAQAEVTLVEKFRVLISQESKCDCCPWTSEDWSSDCFGLSVLVSGKNSFLDQLREDFQGKALSMCLGSNSCEHTEVRRKLLKVPEVLVFQLNFPTKRRKSKVGRSYLVETLNLRDILHEDNALEGYYQLTGAVFVLPGHFFSGFRTPRGWTIFNDSSVSSFNASTFKEFSSKIGAAQPYLVFYQKVGLKVPQSPIPSKLLNISIQALYHLSSEAEVREALKDCEDCRVSQELLRVLLDMHRKSTTGGTASVDSLRREMANSYTSTRLSQGQRIGDLFEAYSAILQKLYSAVSNSKLVKRFSLQISGKSSCGCRTESKDWSGVCFGLPVYMNGGKGFLEQIQEDFRGKRYQYCLSNRSQCTTWMQQEFREVPQLIVFKLNYDSLEVQRYGGWRDPSATRRTNIEEVIDLSWFCELSGVYILQGVVLMVPGHFFSAFKSRSGWKIFNDSSVSDSSCSSFNDLINYCYGRYSQPYLLFYAKEHSCDF
jgi:hypothetical protein